MLMCIISYPFILTFAPYNNVIYTWFISQIHFTDRKNQLKLFNRYCYVLAHRRSACKYCKLLCTKGVLTLTRTVLTDFKHAVNEKCLAHCMLSQFRLSVHLSVTLVDQSKTVEVRITQLLPYSSLILSVFVG